MADYTGLIRVGIEGLGQIRQLNTALERTSSLLGNLENAQIITGQIAESATRNVNRAAQRRALAGRELTGATRTVANVAQRRDLDTGRFLAGGPNATARRLANAQLGLAQRDVRESDRSLREQIRNRRLIAAAEGRYARAVDRATAVLTNTQGRAQEQQLRNQQTMQGIGNASRGNYLTNLFQGRGREFARGGAGAALSPELQQQARNVRAAWDIATAGGQENLRLMQRLATEMSGLVRQQNELNRGRAGRSIAFEAGRRGQERITDLSRMPGADPDKIRRLRSQATNVNYIGNTISDIAGSREAARRLNVSIARYERELNGAARELSTQRQAQIRNFNVAQSWRRVSAEAQRLSAMPRALPDANMLASRIARTSGGIAPTRLDEIRKREARQLATELRIAEGRPERFRKKSLAEEKRQRDLGIGVNAPDRIGGPVKRTGAIPMGGGVDSGIMPRALPSSRALEQRIALSGQRQPTRLDDLQVAAQKRAAEETKRAAGSVGRFGAALEREERRLAGLGIGAPGRVGGASGRSRAGAIPMGGQGGRPGMFDQQYPFPAGPGNPVGIGEFQRIQKAQRQQGQQKGFFQGDLREALGDALIGGAFPLLFGQGLGASVGGAAGGLGGGLIGGNFGFGLSLAGTAIGEAVDTTARNLTELADAIRSPSKALDALEKSGLASSRSLEGTRLYVDQLTSVGRAYDAQTLVLQEVEKRLGSGSVRNLNALSSEQQRLQDQWSVMAGTIQSQLLPALVGFTANINDIIAIAAKVGSLPGVKEAASARNALNKNPVGRSVLGALSPFEGARQLFGKLQDRGRAVAATSAGNRQAQTPEEKLADQTSKVQESRKLADQIQSAYREAFSLQRQAYDLQRDGAMLNRDIADYSYKKEREIFDLRQQAAEKRIDNSRASAQNRIEGSDLSARQTFSAAVGFEQQLLTNVRESVRARKEGEADIEQSRKKLELAMAKLNRDVEDYKRTNAREIEDIEQRKLSYVRSVEDYKIKVADYVLQRSREAADLTRQAIMLPTMGAPAAGGGKTPLTAGAAPRTLMGTPGVVEYLTGDRSSPGYRADHGGSNYHEHIAFASRKIRDNVIAMLQSNGIKIGSTDGGRHAAGSYHYSGQAVDIPASQVPVGKEDALAGRVRALVAAYLGGSAGNVQGQTAAQISSIPQPKFSPVPIGATPSGAKISAANKAANLQVGSGLGEAQRILEETNKLKLKGIELGQIEQILQANQLPQLKQQGDTLKQQIEARQKILDLTDNAASVADIEAESKTRLLQIEKDRVSALAKAQKEYGNDPAVAKQINTLAGKAVEIAKGEEKQRRINLEDNNKLQNQERSRSAILQLQEGLAIGKAQAAALERGALEATNVELLKASDLYRFASDAEKAKLADLTAQTEELSKQNDFRKQVNEIRQDARFTGAGLRAGLIGPEARAYEQGLKTFKGDATMAMGVANETKRLENERLVWANLEKDITSVSDAISGGLTNGLLDIIDGAKTIQDVGRDMLNTVARSFADSAQQQLGTLMQRQLGGLLGGAQGPLVKMLGAGAEVAGPQALGSASMLASGQVAAFGMALQTVTAQMAFSSALGGGSALSGALGSAVSGGATNLFSKGISDAIPGIAFGGFLAEGGTAQAGKGYVVGEKEPEFFFPGVSGRVVPRSDMEKAAALRQGSEQSDPIELGYTVTERQGERMVTEEQMRRNNALLLKQAEARTLARMRNSKEVRDFVNI
jgi:hypothetical protein